MKKSKLLTNILVTTIFTSALCACNAGNTSNSQPNSKNIQNHAINTKVIENNLNNNVTTSLIINQNTRLNQETIDTISKLDNITALELEYLSAEDIILVLKNSPKNITKLSISNGYLEANDIKEIIPLIPNKVTSFTLYYPRPYGSNNAKNEAVMSLIEALCRQKITSLTLSGLTLGVQGAMKIAKSMNHLTSLSLEGAKIGNNGLEYIAKYAHNLEQLNVASNRINDDGIIAFSLKSNPKLTYLNITSNNIGSKGMSAIAKNMNGHLTELELSQSLNPNSLDDIKTISTMTNLKSLTFYDIGNIEQTDYPISPYIQAIASMKNLTNLSIDTEGLIDSIAFESISNMSNLTSLNLARTDNIDDLYVTRIAKLKNLASLDLSDNFRISERNMVFILESLPQLTILKLNGSRFNGSNISDKTAIAISKLTNLTNLELSHNKITNNGARKILKNLKNLTNCDLSYNDIKNINSLPKNVCKF